MRILQIFLKPFQALRNKIFARLYTAQTVSLLGDAFSWVGLALLAYQINPAKSGNILATALTLRVTAYIIFAPFAGVLADRVERKKILYITHFIRMILICCLPFIYAEWQVYVIVFLLNVFNAFFSPTYKSVIPQILEGQLYREAVGLSTATFQLLGVLGPAAAGIVAVWLGARQIFFIDGVSFILAAVLIISIPKKELQKGVSTSNHSENPWKNAGKGIQLLFHSKILRFALAIEFVSAIAGAMILVNTIGHIKNNLLLNEKYYGWIMAVFGLGAAVSAFVVGSLDKTKTRSFSLISGAILIGLAVSFANSVSYGVLLVLWVFAGLGQSLASMPSETLIAENIHPENQGKVYGSHFAISHLWWVLAYPLAGLFGNQFQGSEFLYGGIITLLLALLAMVIFRPHLKY